MRELEHAVERALILSAGSFIDLSDLAPAGANAAEAPTVETLDAVERALVERTLHECDGSVTRAARRLGLTRQALYRRMEKFGLS